MYSYFQDGTAIVRIPTADVAGSKWENYNPASFQDWWKGLAPDTIAENNVNAQENTWNDHADNNRLMSLDSGEPV